MYVAIVQYEAGCFNPKVSVNCRVQVEIQSRKIGFKNRRGAADEVMNLLCSGKVTV